MNQKHAIIELAPVLDAVLPANEKLWYNAVVEKINYLILSDFDQLIQILYRLDISEKKVKQLLKTQKDTDAAEIITQLMIERQLQKIKTRRQFGKRDDNIPDEELW